MDSPVLKPALFRISSARLIGAAASACAAADAAEDTSAGDEGRPTTIPAWVSVLATAVDGVTSDTASTATVGAASTATIGAASTATSGAASTATSGAASTSEPEAENEATRVRPVRVGSTPTTEESRVEGRADEGESRRLIMSARTRLAEIEAETARAEARLGETQALIEQFEREANMACQVAQEAREQAVLVRDEARRQGLQEGIAQAEQEMAEQLARVAALAEGAVRARDEYLRESEPEIIELVIEIARKVIGQELAQNKDALVQVARRALEMAGQSEVYFLHLHPDDAEIVERQLHRDALGMTLQVVPDERMAPGNCLVRTVHGRVDACVETQLHEVRERMLGAA